MSWCFHGWPAQPPPSPRPPPPPPSRKACPASQVEKSIAFLTSFDKAASELESEDEPEEEADDSESDEDEGEPAAETENPEAASNLPES